MFAKKVHDEKLLNKLVQKDGYSVIDTRSPVEYRNGTIFNAPNAPLRNFMTTFIPMARNNSKIVLVGSPDDEAAFKACIRYAEQNASDNTKIRYYYY